MSSFASSALVVTEERILGGWVVDENETSAIVLRVEPNPVGNLNGKPGSAKER
jgi:hypothetical protein